VKSGSPPKRQHLIAFGIAAVITGILLAWGVNFSNGLENRYVSALAADLSEPKLQGVALQKHAFDHPDLLVLYGSSELAKEMPNNAAQFFEDYPTGFRVFRVGQPGAASLLILQKVAAVGDNIEGKKVAFSISPGWFFTEIFDPKYYEGNFSVLQAYELAFNGKLSRGLKRDIALRMLMYPKTLENEWLLRSALRHLAGDSPRRILKPGDSWTFPILLDFLKAEAKRDIHRVLYSLLWPLGRLQCAVGRAQDHFEAVLHIIAEDETLPVSTPPAPKRGHPVNWVDLRKRAAKFAINVISTKRKEVAQKRAKRARDRSPNPTPTFVQTVGKAREWTDLELLLRVFQETGAKPLLLSMPVEDIRLEVYGVSTEVRSAYLRRLDALVAQYHAPLDDFRDHQNDPAFLVDFLDHLSPDGWLYYNKALDDFYHERNP
jgi:D-alanine transfer protein